MENVKELVERQREYFNAGKTKDVLQRINHLRKLKEVIKANEDLIIEALNKDLNKSEFEAYLSEIGIIYQEIDLATKSLNSWSTPYSVRTPISLIGSRSRVYYEPFGLTLIISPWNYPFQLAIASLISAIAAGNCSIVKPSEISANTSGIVRKVIEEAFPSEFVAVVEGDADVSTALLNEKFDYIFFTGSSKVGRIIMEKAAKNLTPVTLELGGKGPCIVHSDAKLKMAAKRIAWGKFINAGQTCISPDYLYVHQDVKEEFLTYLKESIDELYGIDSLENPEYPKIINQNHFERLKKLLQDGETIFGGEFNDEKRSIEPTLLENVPWDAPVMQDEIFGPILPIFEYTDVNKVIAIINSHPKPLSFYLFSSNKILQDKVIADISFGGGCINDVVYHIGNPYLPFGGVGESGFGSYHGKQGFETFSHKKGILTQTTVFDIPLRYSTTRNALKLVKMFLK